jgi:hypothetical protein
MNTHNIIAEIKAEIRKLEQAVAALESVGTAHTPNRRSRSTSKRTMSPEGRKRIAAAQKARWAKVRAAKK